LAGVEGLTTLLDGMLDLALLLRFFLLRFLRDAFEDIRVLAFGGVLHQRVFEPVERDDFEFLDFQGFFDCCR
jgi:hypothetical protein